ncbi:MULTISPECIES: radical SAM family heme chaperone HemW [unclassified Gordonia (in: high G+C Gram-positive bacteria)]|uniref:radical SAM family heme chaperone HemW n=1 Tax=unclassified Gordonia (in: high G+C Gram-positive bacteria) TaxID=2657482 RepID=UPI000990DAF6|nr:MULTISPECIES: radical SAM family heme chaperone HemW [unclassified Gordonia (in: high G+C Gram-positive bacteria)]MCX2753341.1 radical SAM family heme chaperone HemW [Gordonia sp. 4N]
MNVDTTTIAADLVAAACRDVDADVPLALYLHVPFCATRCGYCDFNTYTAGELGSSSSPESWQHAVARELEAASRMLAPTRPVSTIFVGGGTPSLLGGDGLTRLLDAVRVHFDLSDDVEITTESNPESTSPEFFDDLRSAGFTRISLGMQSAAAHVLRLLDRTHTPGRAVAAAREARAAGFDHVNLDLIYGTPGETDADLHATVDAVLDAGVDHVSAYALIVEDGTALARRIRRGEMPAPDDDVLADRYQILDRRLRADGLDWYEVSNWARGEKSVCRHNIAYWHSHDWWGIGPGAHCHVAGVRWLNAKHPARYAKSLADGVLPIASAEQLTPEDRHLEAVMLTTRCRTGLPRDLLDDAETAHAEQLRADGLLTAADDAYVLTDAGRLLADGVIRRVLWG